MTDKVFGQIMRIRGGGKCNRLDLAGALREAYVLGRVFALS